MSLQSTPYSQDFHSDQHLESGLKSVVGLFCRNSLYVKTVSCFHRGAASLMFNGVLNVTLSEEKVSSTGITQGNLELLLSSNSLDSHQTHIQKDEFLD